MRWAAHRSIEPHSTAGLPHFSYIKFHFNYVSLCLALGVAGATSVVAVASNPEPDPQTEESSSSVDNVLVTTTPSTSQRGYRHRAALDRLFPLYQPMDAAEQLGYEVRILERVPDSGDAGCKGHNRVSSESDKGVGGGGGIGLGTELSVTDDFATGSNPSTNCCS